MKFLRWFAINSIFMALLIAGTVYEIEGAANIVVFFTWFLFFVSLAMYTDGAVEIMRKTGFHVSAGIDLAYDLAFLCVMLWHGWMVMSSLYMFHVVASQQLRARIKAANEGVPA